MPEPDVIYVERDDVSLVEVGPESTTAVTVDAESDTLIFTVAPLGPVLVEVSDQPPGPMGPPGTDGTDGVDGVDGVDGADGATNLDGLTDVTLVSPVTGHLLRFNGTLWVNVMESHIGTHALDDLSDAVISSPSNTQFLRYNGTSWVNTTVTIPTNLDSLSDVTITSGSTGEVLRYNGTAWVDATLAMDDLANTTLGSPSTDDVIQWNGSAWVAAAVSGGGGGGDVEDLDNVTLVADDPGEIEWLVWAPGSPGTWYKQPLDITLFPAPSISFLSDVAPMSPSSGDLLTWDGAEWTAAAPSGGASELDDLTDVAISSPADDDFLRWSGTEWINEAVPLGATDLDELSDVIIASPATTQVLIFDGATWVNQTIDLETLSDVDLTSPATDDYLTYDGAKWVNAPLPGAGAFALPDATDVTVSSPNDGEVLTWDSGTSQWKNEAAAGGSLPSRDTETYTTASLATNATETGVVTLAKSYRLLKVETTRLCRLRVYATAAHRTADAARTVGTDPTGDHGLMLEWVSASGVLTVVLSPQVDGTNFEASPTADIPIAIENLGTTGTVAVTFTFLPQEA